MEMQFVDVVTHVEKRESLSQSVPFSLTILEPDNLYNPLLNSIQHVDQRVSSFVETEYNQVTPQLFIRGVGSNASGSGDDPSVAYMVDGINISRPGFHHQQLFDVKQIEVMKGPQGTLYGKGVIGGAVNVALNKPDDTDLNQWFMGVTARGLEIQAVNNHALTDRLNQRLGVAYRDQDGFVENAYTGTDLGSSREITLRDQLAWQDGLHKAGLLLDLNVLDSIDPARVYVGETPYPIFGGEALTPYANNTNKVAVPEDGHTERRHGLVVFNYEVEQSYGTWISQTAYMRGDYEFAFEFVPINYPISTSNSAKESAWQFSQEIRLQQQWQNWQWYSGVFLSREKVLRKEQVDLTGLINLLGISGAITPESPGYTDYDSQNEVYNGAVFAQAKWQFQPQWNLSMGLRGDYVKKDFTLSVTGGDPLGVGLVNSADFDESQQHSWSEVSYSLALDYHFSEQVMAYGLLATGFKSGSFNSLSISPQSALASTRPEKALNKELGLKGFFLEKALMLNLAVFHMDYDDLQVFAGLESEANAPKANISGTELELRLKILEGLELSGNYAYLDAEFEDFLSPADGENLQGNRLLRTPTHALALNLDYSWSDASENRYWLAWHGNSQSRMFSDPGNSRDWTIPGYHVSNLSLLFQPAGSDQRLSFWVRNLENERYPVHVISQSDFLITSQGSSWNMAEPRTLGVTLNLVM